MSPRCTPNRRHRLCNAAHAFLPRTGIGDVRLIPRGVCHRRAEAAAVATGSDPEQSRDAGQPDLHAAAGRGGIAYVEPPDRIQDALMRAITRVQGAPTGRRRPSRARRSSPSSWRRTLTSAASSPRVRRSPDSRSGEADGKRGSEGRLSRMDVVDPVELALHHAVSETVESAGAA